MIQLTQEGIDMLDRDRAAVMALLKSRHGDGLALGPPAAISTGSGPTSL
jgi:hypothetical protein